MATGQANLYPIKDIIRYKPTAIHLAMDVWPTYVRRMALSAEKVAELRVKHLEMVQVVVSRMAGYGASFKGLCITLTTAVCGFGITLHQPLVVLLAIFPMVAFAILGSEPKQVNRECG